MIGLRSGSSEDDEDQVKALFDDAKEWYSSLLEKCDHYLPIPDIMNHALKTFVIKGNEFHADNYGMSEVGCFDLIDFHEASNCEFVKCSQACRGLYACSCIDLENKKFTKHFLANFKPSESSKFTLTPIVEPGQQDVKDVTYLQAFLRYLSEDGFHQSLNCPNMMR